MADGARATIFEFSDEFVLSYENIMRAIRTGEGLNKDY